MKLCCTSGADHRMPSVLAIARAVDDQPPRTIQEDRTMPTITNTYAQTPTPAPQPSELEQAAADLRAAEAQQRALDTAERALFDAARAVDRAIAEIQKASYDVVGLSPGIVRAQERLMAAARGASK